MKLVARLLLLQGPCGNEVLLKITLLILNDQCFSSNPEPPKVEITQEHRRIQWFLNSF